MYEYKKRDKSETTTMYYYYVYLLFVSFWFCLQNIYKSGNPNARKQTVIRRFQLYYGFNDMACYACGMPVCRGSSSYGV